MPRLTRSSARDLIGTLRTIRLSCALTQAEWADAIGVHPIQVAKWEGGTTPVSPRVWSHYRLLAAWLSAAWGYQLGCWRCECPAEEGKHGNGCPAAAMERGLTTPRARPAEVVEMVKMVKRMEMEAES